eukprot:g23358.t1
MENFKPKYKQPAVRLQLLVNSYQAGTSVTVTLGGKLAFRKELALGAGQTAVVEMPACSEVTGSALTPKTVTVRADKGVTVTSFSSKPLSVDTAVVPPVCALGKSYYVFTPPTGPRNMLKEFAVVNAGEANQVTVNLSQTVYFEGKFHARGSRVTFLLAAYQSALFQSRNDLTGTRVDGKVPFALVSGHSCSMVSFKCNHVYEHLPPVESWGTHYAVAPSSAQRKYDQLYIVASQPTEVTVSTEEHQRQLKEGQAAWVKVSNGRPVAVMANKPVMAVYFSPGTRRWHRSGYDPFLITVAPSEQLANSYITQGLPGFLNFLTVVSRSNETGHVLLDERADLRGAMWKAIPGSEYSWLEIALGSDHGRHEVRTAPGQGIAVYKYGVANMNAYGSQANAHGQQGAH